MTTEDAPDRAQGALVPTDHEAETPGYSVELTLACCLHRTFKELVTAGRWVDRWFAEGCPVDGLPVAGPLADQTPLLSLVAALHREPARILQPDAVAEVEEALWPVARRLAGPGLGVRVKTRFACFMVSEQLVALLRQRVTVEATVNHPAFGISGDWAELHELVEARARRVEGEAPFVLDLTECFLAEELLERARDWAEAGRPPALNPDDEVCIAWLADRIHWLPCREAGDVPEDRTRASPRPTLRHDHALQLLLTDPVALCLAAHEAEAEAPTADCPAADPDDCPLGGVPGETEPATP